jgi:hypothetical protein
MAVNKIKLNSNGNSWFNGGNVGIGTSDPTTILNINTGSTVGGNTKNCAIKFNNHDAGARFVVWDNGTSVNDYAGLGKTSAALDICIPSSSNSFVFKAAGTELMRIKGNGNVGIGTNNPADDKLHIYENANDNVQLKIQNDYASARAGLSLENDGGTFNIQAHSGKAIIENYGTVGTYFYQKGTGIFRFSTTDSNTVRLTILTDGNVGIGTNSPSAKFCIQDGGIHMRNGMGNGDTRPAVTTGANTPTYEIRGVGGGSGSNVTSDDGFLRLRAGGGSATACSSHIDLSGYNTNGDMDRNITFTTYDAERMRIDINGNVGIGDTSPDYKLDVAGDINFTGSLYQNGSAFGGGLWSESSDTATYTTLSVGDVGHGTTWAGIAHSSSTSSTGYAVIQNSSGQTLLNCQSGAKIGFREANQEKMYLQGGVLNVAGNVTAGSMTCNGNLIASGYIQGKQPFCQIQLGGSTENNSSDVYENKNQTANETWQYVYLTHTRTGQTAGGNHSGTWGNSLTYNRSFEYNYGFNDSNTNNSTSANSPSTMYQIKVNVAGIYQFNYMLKMYCESDGSDTEVYCIVQKNATGQWYGVNRKMLPHAKEAVVNGSDMVVMNANDWLCVRVYFRKTSGSINYSYDYGKFSCMMVGKI